jgi:hypothetical protein
MVDELHILTQGMMPNIQHGLLLAGLICGSGARSAAKQAEEKIRQSPNSGVWPRRVRMKQNWR